MKIAIGIVIGLVMGIFIGIILGAVSSGIITAKIVKDNLKPKFTDDASECKYVLPSYSVIIEGLPANPAKAADDDNIGYGTKLGGEPDWIQGADIPICPSCGIAMVFVAQIDSIAMADKSKHAEKDRKTGKKIQEFMFGDAGMIYVFACMDDGEVAGVEQCY
jgi:hypothetical protein